MGFSNKKIRWNVLNTENHEVIVHLNFPHCALLRWFVAQTVDPTSSTCVYIFEFGSTGRRDRSYPRFFSLKYFITGFPFIHFLLNKYAAVLAGFG